MSVYEVWDIISGNLIWCGEDLEEAKGIIEGYPDELTILEYLEYDNGEYVEFEYKERN